MLALIKIRLTYLKRKKCLFFFSYLLIPLIIGIACIIYFAITKEKKKSKIYPKIKFDYDYESYLFKISNESEYLYILPFLKNTSLISNNEDIGKAFKLYILNNLDIDLDIYPDEKSLDKNATNIIKIEYDEKKNSFKFSYVQNYGSELLVDSDPQFAFPFLITSTQNIADIFSLYHSAIDFENDTSGEYKKLNDYYLYQVGKNNNYFLFYQSLICRFLIEYQKGITSIDKNIRFKYGYNSFPEAIDDNGNYYEILGRISSYTIVLQYTFIFLFISYQMVEEKEQKLQKLLERQGIGEIKYILSWFINYLIVGLFSDIIIILAMIFFMQTLHGLFIVDIILFVLAQFPLVYLIIIISSNIKNGMILVNIIGFSTLAIGSILEEGKPHRPLQMFFNIFPNVNEFSMLKVIYKMEQIGVYSADIVKLKFNKINYIDNLIMFIVEICIYSLIAIFIRTYQVSGLPFFDFIKSIFTKVNRKIKSENDVINKENKKNYFKKNHEELNTTNNELKKNNIYLNIKNVTKRYGNLKAVNNFNGELFKNEIFCLLGHNGAGKTTLIKMISGTEDPDNGDIFLNNISIITNKNYLYNNIGLCQQEDILFNYLTVKEHLIYMIELKGAEKDTLQIDTFINKIDLTSKKNAICQTLSGGEKRKLCIALALIGNSQLVLLDEPTSGMDVISKRHLWNFLKEFKKDKIIILTTHSLDEAEYLGDRIGIMSDGEFICSGTSSFLKSKYPCGFNLNLLVNSETFTLEKKHELYNQLIQYEPNLEIKISSKKLFSVNIESNNKNIKEIFKIIEENKSKYGIEDYTVSSTTLEDVFLKLNHKVNINEDKKSEAINNKGILIKDDDDNDDKKVTSFIFQLLSHIKRGFFSIWRNKTLFILELLVGLFVLYIYVLIQYNILGHMSKETLSFIELLEYNDIFVCKDNVEFFKSSYVYEDLNSIKLKIINKKNDKNEFIEEIYKNSLGHIGKSGLCLINTNSNIYDIYNTEIPMNIPGYMMANMMFSISAFLKKEYNINAEIFTEIVNLKSTDIGGMGIDSSEMSTMFSLCYACLISIFLYLGSIISEKIKERIKNIKHILYLSGSNIWSYWCGFYIVDLIKLLIFSSLASASLYIINSFASLIWINFIITSFSFLPFVYALSFILEKEESGQKALNLITFLIIIILFIYILIILNTQKDFNISFFMNKYNFTICDITPITSFMLAYLRLVFSYLIFNGKIFKDLDEIQISIIGKVYRPKVYLLTSLMIQIINFIFYSCLLILFESGILRKLFNNLKVKLSREDNITFSNPQIPQEVIINNNINKNEDKEDITSENEIYIRYNNNINNNINNYIENEINKINNDNQNKLTIKIIGLKKTYWLCCKKSVRAINNLYLGLENNEKFGLLGFNGSGKTTTFKTITKELLYDSGSIFLFGKNIETEFEQIRSSIGYCPQENPIFDYMKVREIISFYLELKNVKETTESICEKFGLYNFLDTYCINLSGGNKRKLSFALALMCKPKLLLLDEPSTGVDPESRRIMWKNITNLNKTGNQFNMILTTHSMEEAEVLCDTVSWLKSGNFISIGNPEKLKIILSAGYKLNMKFIQLNQDNCYDEITFDNTIKNLSDMIKEFNACYNNIIKMENIKPYIIELGKVINSIKDKCEEIYLQKINNDFSFEFNIKIIKERQADLFIQVLEMKNTNNLLSEISISMESLENVLTRL